jgi:hypothetical protein
MCLNPRNNPRVHLIIQPRTIWASFEGQVCPSDEFSDLGTLYSFPKDFQRQEREQELRRNDALAQKASCFIELREFMLVASHQRRQVF